MLFPPHRHGSRLRVSLQKRGDPLPEFGIGSQRTRADPFARLGHFQNLARNSSSGTYSNGRCSHSLDLADQSKNKPQGNRSGPRLSGPRLIPRSARTVSLPVTNRTVSRAINVSIGFTRPLSRTGKGERG